MIAPIANIIAELQRIPCATWTGSDPARHPVLYPSGPRDVNTAGHAPVFDDADFTPAASPQWEEAIRAVAPRLAPKGDGDGGSGAVDIDALAWYASFHDNPEGWGIYVPLSSLPLIDDRYLSDLPMSRPARWRLAWDVLMAHEIVHFAVDYACAWFELLYHAPIRRAFCDRMSAGMAGDVFTDQANYLEVEESLANGHVLRKVVAQADPAITQVLRHFIRQQPSGYRDGELAESDAGFAAIAAETLRSYLAVWSSGWNIDPGNTALDLARLLPLGEDAHRACTVWIINDLESVGLPRDAVKLITCVRPIEETKPFRRRFRRLHLDHQRAWARLKEGIANGIPNGSDFKPWKHDGVWPVRVNGNIRAHLKQPPRGDADQPWLALEIGSHKEMGHD